MQQLRKLISNLMSDTRVPLSVYDFSHIFFLKLMFPFVEKNLQR